MKDPSVHLKLFLEPHLHSCRAHLMLPPTPTRLRTKRAEHLKYANPKRSFLKRPRLFCLHFFGGDSHNNKMHLLALACSVGFVAVGYTNCSPWWFIWCKAALRSCGSAGGSSIVHLDWRNASKGWRWTCAWGTMFCTDTASAAEAPNKELHRCRPSIIYC